MGGLAEDRRRCRFRDDVFLGHVALQLVVGGAFLGKSFLLDWEKNDRVTTNY